TGAGAAGRPGGLVRGASFAMLEEAVWHRHEGPRAMSTSTSEPAPAAPAPPARRPALDQAITGVVPPLLAEATIRTVWPSVTDASPAVANLGRTLIKTIVLAP